MQRKYVTKKLVKRISSLTNQIFKQSIVEVMDIKDATEEELQDFMSKVRRASLSYASWSDDDGDVADIIAKKEKIDELYLNKMIALPTKDLTDILFLHEFNKPKRAQRTLEAIISEIARRSLLDDSSQSDTIYTNGDVDVKRKSKANSKKTNSKKCKTSKNRRVV